MARSRAFSGTSSAFGVKSKFDPKLYVFTLLLVAAYVGLGLGTVEQAANGAAVVLCAAILKDFVAPKLAGNRKRKTKVYVICPLIDMANHRSFSRCQADVSFEVFGNAYSLALASAPSSSASAPTSGNAKEEVWISYGPRSNDQLLQYYGFVERDNPHDVYVLPPLREWDVAALEAACGRSLVAGRLAQLDRAGLLGGSGPAARGGGADHDPEEGDGGVDADGGVVVTPADGVDPAVMQALRALVSTSQEWERAGGAIGNFASENSGGADNERCARRAALAALQLELQSKPTTLEEDVRLLRRLEAAPSLDIASPEEKLAIQFRIEKKKLLVEAIEKLALDPCET
jgi:hypothetical protein